MLILQSRIWSPLETVNIGTVNNKYVPFLHRTLLFLSVGG